MKIYTRSNLYAQNSSIRPGGAKNVPCLGLTVFKKKHKEAIFLKIMFIERRDIGV